MNHSRKIFPEMGMPCVQTNTNFARIQCTQNPQKVSGPASKQMWEHIFQHKTDTQLPAV